MGKEVERVLSSPSSSDNHSRTNVNHNNNNNDENMMLNKNDGNDDDDDDASEISDDTNSVLSSIHTIHVSEDEIDIIDEEVVCIAEQSNNKSAAPIIADSIITGANNNTGNSDYIDPDAVDTLLAKEIDNLTFQERNDIYEEIHGVSNMAAKETPELIKESLRRMSEEIDKIGIDDNSSGDLELKRAYEIVTACTATSCRGDDAQHTTTVATARHNHSASAALGVEIGGATKSDGDTNMKKTSSSSTSTFNSNSFSNTTSSTRSRNNNIDDQFRLRFLRCDLFNPKSAARRLCTFYDVIYSFYGAKGLQKFVSIITNTNTNNTGGNKKKNNTLMDFFLEKRADMIAFRAGFIQILPFRDRSGRKIIVFVLDALKLESVQRLKIWLYMIFVSSEDIETQRNGVVVIFWPGLDYNIDIPQSKHRSLVRKIFNGIPTRFASFHFCFPNTHFFHLMRSMLALTMTPMRQRTRVKIHSGERIEIQYELMGYGIPISLLPTTETGRLKTKNCTQWIKARKLLEEYNNNNHNHTAMAITEDDKRNQKQDKHDDTSVIRIDCPGVNDVIFRSAGKSCMNNPGNVVFRGYFEMYHDEHVTSNQTHKKEIIWSIVEEIESKHGKFLNWEKEGGWWVPIQDRNEIRSKVAISFRDYNKQRRAVNHTNQQTIKSSTFAFIRQDGSKNKRRKSTTTRTHTCSTTGRGKESRRNSVNSSNSDGTSSEDDTFLQHDRSCFNNNVNHNDNGNGNGNNNGDDCFLCSLSNCIKY